MSKLESLPYLQRTFEIHFDCSERTKSVYRMLRAERDARCAPLSLVAPAIPALNNGSRWM